MNTFKNYLSDYIMKIGRCHLPDTEGYSIKVLDDCEIENYFSKIDMSKSSMNQIRKS